MRLYHCVARIAAVALAISICAGCSPKSGNKPATPAPAILLRGAGPEPDSLDPQRAQTVEAQTILRDLCEGLTTLGKSAEVAPGVATDWTVSSDGRTYTFNLRPNVKWSNGDSLVAADFVAGFRRLVDPATASPYAAVIDDIVNAKEIIAGAKPPDALGVHATNDATIVIDLVSPAAYLPTLVAHPCACPVHRPTLTQHPEQLSKPGVMLSDGAFVLKEWIQGSYILLVRNRRYWNDSGTRLDGVQYVVTADENAELTRYRAGQLQVTYTVPRGQFDWIKANLGSQLHVSPQLGTYYYGFNLNRPPFQNQPGLRRALSLTVDRELLASHVLRVGELPAYGWIPPGISNYSAQSFDYRMTPISARLAEARHLYAEAGYSSSHPLQFELRYNDGEIHSKLAIAVASMWKEALGVQVRLTAVEFKSLLQDIATGDVEMFRSSWQGDYNDAYSFAQYFESNFGVNMPHYHSTAYDALMADATRQTDAARRRQLLEDAERSMLRDHPVVPLYFYVNKHLVKPEVEGWYDNIINVVYSRDLALR